VTSHDYDREKLSAYAAAGVKEAWLVLGPEHQVEVFRRPEAGRYAESQVLTPDSILASTTLPGITVPLSELFRA
jgi:Uma2 family endonuclease